MCEVLPQHTHLMCSESSIAKRGEKKASKQFRQGKHMGKESWLASQQRGFQYEGKGQRDFSSHQLVRIKSDGNCGFFFQEGCTSGKLSAFLLDSGEAIKPALKVVL